MNPFEDLTTPRKMSLLICFCDVDGFSAVAKARPDPIDLFELLDGMARELSGLLDGSEGRVVKYIGDSALIVFPESAVDAGVRLLREAKTRLEAYLARRGARTTLTFLLHFGEVAVGKFGNGGWDVLGDAVNTAARLEQRREHRGGFAISPQVFRKLRPETRRSFHKYTPPITYMADR